MAAKRKGDFLRLVIDRETAVPKIKGVYLVTDHGDRLVERVRSAIAGGVSILQYRNKWKRGEESLAGGMELKRLCAEAGIPFIVNDDLDLARRLDADGLHLGQEDGDPAAARHILGPKKIIGVSTHNLDEAIRAQEAGADYIGFGAMFPSVSKAVTHVAGPAALAAIRPRIGIPIVAIGGITRDNAPQVIDAGADAVAVISAVLGHKEPGLAAAELSLLFRRKGAFPQGAVLTVAGSDSGGGAGIQADLKTITLLGSYGASVLTALTAQNTRGVSDILGIASSFVKEQLEAVLSDIPIDVVKTGMLHSLETASLVADSLRRFDKRFIIIDPVMTAKGGADLTDGRAIGAIVRELLPIAYLLTPNIPEAERLTGCTIGNEEGMEDAARKLHEMGARNVLIKGGHLPEGTAVDLFFDGSGFTRFPAPRILTKNTHGTGCTLASAISAFLARGEPLTTAIAMAKEFITAAIKLAQPLGKGHGPVNHFLASRKVVRN